MGDLMRPRFDPQPRRLLGVRWPRRARTLPEAEDRPTAVRGELVIMGVLLFLLGLLAFVMFQTQVMFTDNARISEIRPGLAPRNDGGILFGATLASVGTGLMLFAVSPLRWRRRLVPAALVTASTAMLLWTHFTIFVNAFLVPRARSADLTASFLFHDTANALPIATFILATLTLLLLLALVSSALALTVPTVWHTHILHPTKLDEHRTRLILMTLLIIGVAAAFVRQFFEYALTGDARPTGGFVNTNVTVVYYMLALATLLAVAGLAWRTYTLAWRDLRGTRSQTYRRAYAYLTTAETWLWSISLLLNSILLLAGPTYQPDSSIDRVFSMNSKGVAIFFMLVPALYFVHRKASQAQLRHLAQQPVSLGPRRWDALGTMASSVIATWVGLTLILWSADVTPFVRLLTRVTAIAVILPWFAVRFDAQHLGRPLLRTVGSPYILLATVAVAMLAGIMLWGSGNSVTTRYVETGGFVSSVQAYATGVRMLGSLFLAVPATLGLWFLSTRIRGAVHPGPLLVVGFSILIGMNLLLTIQAADPRDSAIGRTDVLVGFSVIGLPTLFDRVVVISAWIATAAMGFLATALLLYQATRPAQSTPGADQTPAA